MNEKNIKDLFKKAAEIAKVVPEIMRPMAFSRALDYIINTTSYPEPSRHKERFGRSKHKKHEKVSDKEKVDLADKIIKQLNRTKYPQISILKKVKDRSLMVLKIAQDEFEIDGLTPPQIAEILTKKFRLKTSRQAVHMAMEDAGALVDRMPGSGKAYKYSLMAPGEQHLKKTLKTE